MPRLFRPVVVVTALLLSLAAVFWWAFTERSGYLSEKSEAGSSHVSGGKSGAVQKVAWLEMGESPELAPIGEEIRSLAIGPSGALWVATSKGLSRLSEGKFRHFTRAEGLPDEQVYALAATQDAVLAATREGLVRFADPMPPASEAEVLVSHFVPAVFLWGNEIWTGWNEGRYSYIGKWLLGEKSRPSLLPPLINTQIRRLLPFRDGRLLYRTTQEWYSLDTTEHPQPRKWSGPEPVTALSTQKGTLVLTTSTLSLQESGPTAGEPRSIHRGRGFSCLAPARRPNSVWLCSKRYLEEIDLDRPGVIVRSIRLPTGAQPTAVAEDLLGRLWLGTSNGLLVADPQRSWIVDWSSTAPQAERALSSEDKGKAARTASLETTGGSSTFNPGSWKVGFMQDDRIWAAKPNSLALEDPQSHTLVPRTVNGMVLDVLDQERHFLVPKDCGLDSSIAVAHDSLEALETKDELAPLITSNPELYRMLPGSIPVEDLPYLDFSDELLRRLMAEAGTALLQRLSARIFDECQPLAGFKNDFVVKKNAELELHHGDKVLPLPRSSMVEGLSSSMVLPGSQEILSSTRDGDMWLLDRNFSLRQFEAPEESLLFSLDLTTSSPFSQVIGVDRVTGTWWRFDLTERTWSTLIKPLGEFSPGARILGLLPDPEGPGFLAGCWGCGKENFFRVGTDGSAKPIPAPFDKIGCGSNALLVDHKKRLWVSSLQGVFVREDGGKSFNPLINSEDNTPLNVHANSLLEHPSRGQVWLAAGANPKGLWLSEDGRKARHVLPTSETAVTLWFEDSSGNAPKIWIGGENLLTSYDINTSQPVSHLDWLQDVLATTEQITVHAGMEEQGAMLVMTDRGLVRLSGGNSDVVELPGWPGELFSFDSADVRRLRTGEVIVFASTYDGYTRLWIKHGAHQPFTSVGEIDSSIACMTESASGQVVLGASRGEIIALQNGRPESFSRLVKPLRQRTPQLVPPLRSVCPIGSDDLLLLGDEPHPFFASGKATPKLLKTEVPAWEGCGELSDSRLLLFSPLHTNQLTILTLRKDSVLDVKKYRIEDRVHRLSWSKDRTPVLLGEKWLWKFDPATERAERIKEIPPKVSVGARNVHMALSGNGDIWLGSSAGAGIGLWRYPWKSQPGNGLADWEAWDEFDGLPSRIVNAILPYGDTEVVVFTPTGYYRASAKKSKESGDFKLGLPQGFLGESVNSAALFDLDGKRALALGTDQGVSLVHWTDKAMSQGLWSHLNRSTGLVGNTVYTLAWVSKQKTGELWIGTEAGVTIVELSLKNGLIIAGKPRVITEAQQLPRGKVLGISVSPDGKNAWVLTNNQVSRWESQSGRVVASSEPFLFAASNVILGPARNDRPPRLLATDSTGTWSVWEPADYNPPRLTVHNDWLFWVTPKLKENSLEPRPRDGTWDVSYALDHPDNAPSRWKLMLSPDLWRKGQPRVMIASIRREGESTSRYILDGEIPQTPAGLRYLRLAILYVLFAVAVVTPIWHFRYRSVQAERLRRKEIPYIEGEAIQNPSQFFGRRDLLNTIRDTLAGASWALVGEFRIGKTSIQHQLSALLRSLNDREYVFFPVFIDLEYLEGRNDWFFYLLGRNLVTLAQSQEVPGAVLDRLQLPKARTAGEYDSLSLTDDLKVLLRYWSEKFDPRRPVIVFQIDEISLMGRLDYDTLLAFRAIFVSEPLVKTVLSGRTLPCKEGTPELSPWWNFISPERIEEVEPLTPAEARELIIKPVRGLFSFDSDVVEHIIARSEGKPLTLQALCSNLLRYKYSIPRLTRRITMEDLRASINQARLEGPHSKEELQ